MLSLASVVLLARSHLPERFLRPRSFATPRPELPLPTLAERSWLTPVIAAFGISLVLLLTEFTMGGQGTPSMVASMGASAVILYAMPETPAARTWPLFGGHLLSAIVGILTLRYFSDPLLGVALAVGGSLLLMRGLRCVHPPGGATALTVVQGGAEFRELGFRFLVSPLLLNLLVLGSTALLLRSIARIPAIRR